jgi:hypothetical protein
LILVQQSTVVTTVTTNVEATVSVAAPTVTIPVNIVPNGAFENDATTGNLLPWTETGGIAPARVEPIYPLSVCGPNGDWYVKSQAFDGCPFHDLGSIP